MRMAVIDVIIWAWFAMLHVSLELSACFNLILLVCSAKVNWSELTLWTSVIIGVTTTLLLFIMGMVLVALLSTQ